ncbi:MAG: hypothetical protein ACRC6A_02130 [Fusobacteriaceae bacterium]
MAKKRKKYKEKINIHEFKEELKKFSNTLFFLNKKGFYSPDVNKSSKVVKIKMPKTFSIIENPDTVFNILKEILNSSYSLTEEIDFDYSEVEKVDLGAVLLKNVICLCLRERGMNFSGNFPGVNDLDSSKEIKGKYKEAIEIIIYSGIFKVLQMNPDEYIGKRSRPLTLELRGNGKNYINIPCKKIKLGRVEYEITEYFNKVLKVSVGKQLTENGVRVFDKIIGEVVANCQEHSGDFNQYFCSGHYTQLTEGVGRYQLTIFNLGQTIAEGLENSKHIPDTLKARIEELIKIHSEKKYLWSKSWDKESLLTLYSLQNKVSRMYNEKKVRGTGTVRMLKSFQEVGGCCKDDCIPKMTIISGSTQIIIDNSKICELNQKQITFNESKKLEDPPNQNYVKKISSFFPGTIISLNIYLDKTWIENQQNSQ